MNSPRKISKYSPVKYEPYQVTQCRLCTYCKRSPMTFSTSGGKALLILTNADKQGGNKALRSSTVKTEEEQCIWIWIRWGASKPLLPDNNVESAFIARRAMEYDLGKAYWMERWDMRLTAKACFSKSGWLNNSGAKSKQMCIEGTPATVTESSSKG